MCMYRLPELDYAFDFDKIANAKIIARNMETLEEMGLLLSPFDELNGEFWGSDPYDDGPEY